jgi:hypothetical protein
MARRNFIFLTFSMLLAAGCDRPTASPSTGKPPERDAVPEHPIVEIKPITPLLPRLATHVAVDLRGNLYWIQESDPVPSGGDLVFTMGESGVPQTVPDLGVRRMLEAIGVGGDKSSGGAIRALVIGPGNALYALFIGGSRRVPICAVLRYMPGVAGVELVADTHRIMEASGLGASIELARASLVGHGPDLWLWLRHTDDGAVLHITDTGTRSGFDVHRLAGKPPARIAKGQFISDREDLAAGPGHMLYYIDRRRAMLWKIDARGEYTATQSLEGFSSDLTPPVVDDNERLAFIAGDAVPLVSRDFAPTGALVPQGKASVNWFTLTYPAFLQIQPRAGDGPQIFSIKRDDFIAPAALPLQALRPTQLLLDPSNGSLITFDAASGELLRLKVTHK